MITLCKTCGTAYDEQPKNCPICDDERQYVPVTGQAWTDFYSLTTTHTNKWQQLEPQLFSIKTVPAFAINQRAYRRAVTHHPLPIAGVQVDRRVKRGGPLLHGGVVMRVRNRDRADAPEGVN
ncbi:hypothetical protein AAV10_23645 [Enterobacter hormaechei]|nr:hypothetical protein AAV10_23645 [Enterobacter hormaechei]